MNKLYYSTVSPALRKILEHLMSVGLFRPFRLVGGTALSLRIGHRMSVDIDLFTEQHYGSINFDVVEDFFRSHYKYVDTSTGGVIGSGRMYMLGDDENSSVKVDIMYTDEFIREAVVVDGIRLASIEDIIAMKLDILPLGGRKKDFWDLHALTDSYSLKEMIALHEERYPYSHDSAAIVHGFADFSQADHELDPRCLQGKHWEFIRDDLMEFAQSKK